MQERLWKKTIPVTWLTGAATILSPTLAYRQVIPATDGTGTTVVKNGSRFDITDGTKAGANLFHNFESLNIESNETANFLPDSGVLNIVSQVSGGSPAYIEVKTVLMKTAAAFSRSAS